MNDSRIEEGKRVIRLEAGVLEKLAQNLDDNFCKALDVLAACKGKVIVSGMGKAGLIARKISATFSSLGTSSFFMHPAEAAHGDLGMLTKDDAVILISNSGESSEITQIVPSIKALGAKLIGMTGRAKSFLARECDVLLDIGEIEEACAMGLAPTSSTTAILAMGDALAVTLMKSRGEFSEKDFAFFHPGGALGKKLMKTRDLMRKGADCVILDGSVKVKDVLSAISHAHAGCAVITGHDGKLAGVFSDGDLRRNLEKNPHILESIVADVMTKNPKNISADSFALEGLKLLRDFMIGDIPVIGEGGKPAGVLSLKDLIAVGLV